MVSCSTEIRTQGFRAETLKNMVSCSLGVRNPAFRAEAFKNVVPCSTADRNQGSRDETLKNMLSCSTGVRHRGFRAETFKNMAGFVKHGSPKSRFLCRCRLLRAAQESVQDVPFVAHFRNMCFCWPSRRDLFLTRSIFSGVYSTELCVCW